MPLVAPSVLDRTFDVCIVGAGPAGLACAFDCHDRGLRVLVLDAGGERPTPGSPDILAAEITSPNAHDPTEIVAASALGGSTHWWGGRCVTLDPVDFREWPINWDAMLPWWKRAADLLGAGAAVASPAPENFERLASFDATTTETWPPTRVLSRHWRRRLRTASGPAILLGARVIALNCADGSLASLDVLTEGGIRQVRAPRFVLSTGGLGAIRLMLLAQRAQPHLFGGAGGPLGRGYMGHLTGSIADLVFATSGHAQAFNVFRATAGYLARRRIIPRRHTVESNPIGNTAFWIENPAYGSAAHGSAASSARYLAACAIRSARGATPPARSALQQHFANVARAPWTAAVGLATAACGLAGAGMTGFGRTPSGYLSSGEGGWRLVYHAEQQSDVSNRITLAEEKDSLGLPKLRIDFRFLDQDTAAVVRVHELLDEDLRKAGAGQLRWFEGDRQSLVAACARDGYHQLGGTVMGTDPRTSIVDPECKVHGLNNLWIASSSVFPTSGQANPTLTIIALACRVAGQLVTATQQASADSA
jgi:choline dehydrogenase-like flavoprotein